MKRCRIVHVVGARPNFMKIAAVLEACRRSTSLENVLVHTGQHYDEKMSKLFFDELGIPKPDLDLGVGGGSHADQTSRLIREFEPVVLERKPDLVLVVGDVNSTLACSLVAAKLGVAVAHVEAGLRSFDRTMPEEINRVVTDSISDLLFVSEPSGLSNLAREGVSDEKVHLVGNVMIDTLMRHKERAAESRILEELGTPEGGYAVMTLHRPANVDAAESLRDLLTPVAELALDLPVVFPVHPRTVKSLEPALAGLKGAERIRTVAPLGYLDFLRLMMSARLVLTDSGGIQEETTVLRVPCVTMRANTERPVTITHGTNRLGGVSSSGVRDAIRDALTTDPDEGDSPPMWDGRASERIASILDAWWGSGRPSEART